MINGIILFVYSQQCDECVVSVGCGRFSSSEHDEIVVCTYTGWIFALSTEPLTNTSTGSTGGVAKLSPQIALMINHLRNEVDELEQRIIEEEQYHHEIVTQNSTDSQVIPQFVVQERFRLDPSLHCYTLTISLLVPIDFVMLQSDVAVELLDVEKNSAIVSISPTDPDSKNALLATYRCQANTTVIEIQLRATEGQYGRLSAYICPKMQPKMCKVRSFQIKPLSLHHRSHRYDTALPSNTLRINGNFTVAEAHQWLALLTSEVPERVPSTEQVAFSFISALTGTQMQANYSRGVVVYHSDCISTIAIIRDVLSKEITKRQCKVDMHYELNDDSTPHVLRLLQPKLEKHKTLLRNCALSRAFKEVIDNQADSSILPPEATELLATSDQLFTEIEQSNYLFERLSAAIVELFIGG